MSNVTPYDGAQIEAWLRRELAEQLGIAEKRIPSAVRFNDYGVDSLRATGIVTRLGAWLGRALPATLLWEHPSVELLTRHLASWTPPSTGSQPTERAHLAAAIDEPIAIIGIACRFPGGAGSPEEYWRLLRDGVDAVGNVPEDRWNADALFDADRTAPGKLNTRRGGFIAEVDRFDSAFFGISPREATHMDPQQRLILELAWEAFEDAAILPAQLMGSATGVFVGAMWSDYARRFDAQPRLIEQYSATGFDTSIIPARVAYALGLQGPALAVNTACSSSLVAVHLACQSLRTGESKLAIAGGVSLMISPVSTIAMTKFGALSPDGRCKAFDAGANGYVRGEGGGLVVLKPLSRALADGDPVYCVVRGSAVNNDGFSNGLTAPNPKAQERVLREAYTRAGVEPCEVAYVETHGPGTLLGDPIEAGALGAVLGVDRAADRPLRIGSVKTNLGHTEAAAGIAGLIKVALAMKHHQLPPSLHFEQPSPHIPFARLGLAVQAELGAWPRTEKVPVAGVSSFGFGGTNCHVVLGAAVESTAQLVTLADNDLGVLAKRARELAARATTITTPDELASACRTAGRLDAEGTYRVALVAHGPADLARLPAIEPSVTAKKPRVVFACPGQGAQWLGMGVSLLRSESVFRATLEACDHAIRRELGWSVIERLTASERQHRDGGGVLERADVVQPTLFSIQVSLGALWRSWGIEPDAVIGFSQGEIAAAHIAGILTLDDAVRVVCRRSALIREQAPPGAMLVVAMSAHDVDAVIADTGIVIAGYSSPSATVLSGDIAAIERVLARLTAADVLAARINVDYASHSAAMDGLHDELATALSGIAPRAATVRMVSTVVVDTLEGPECGPAYWQRNLREPVRFQAVVESLLEEGATIFVELSPHPLLSRSIGETIAYHRADAGALASCRRDEDERGVLLESLAELFTRGAIHRCPVARPLVLPLSAKSEPALRGQAAALATKLDGLEDESLSSVVFTAATRRTHHEHRRAVVGRSMRELVDALWRHAHDGPSEMAGDASADPPSPRRIVFVFPGQGGQWVGMGRTLLEQEPVFRDAVRACDRAMRPHVDWRLLDVLNGEGPHAGLEDVAVVQPAIFGMQVGLAALWRSWGIEPAAVVGHSLGEVAAAAVSGALSLDAAARVICVRSRLVRQARGNGGMATVELTAEEAREAVRGFEGKLEIAAVNGPRSTVLSGDRDALAAVIERLSATGVFCRLIKVDYASHSPHMEPLHGALANELTGLPTERNALPFYSTVTGSWLQAPVDASYWQRNLREPVRFWDAVQGLWRDGHDTFIEVNAHPVLLSSIEDGLGHEPSLVTIPSLKRDEGLERMMAGAGTLYTHGVNLTWSALARPARVVSLPCYAWQRERAWITDIDTTDSGRQASVTGEHALLGTSVHDADRPGEQIWQTRLDLATPTFRHLADHVIQGTVVMPAAAAAAIALAAGELLFAGGRYTLVDVELTRILPFIDGAATIRLAVSEPGTGRYTFQLASAAVPDTAAGTVWTTHVAGSLEQSPHPTNATLESIREIEQRIDSELDVTGFYRALASLGYAYGPAFQRITRLRRRPGEALAELRGIDDVPSTGDPFMLHPSLLDACFQLGLAASEAYERFLAGGEPWLPVGIARLHLHRHASGRLVVHCRSRTTGIGRQTSDLTVRDDHGQLVLEVEGLRWQRVPSATTQGSELQYELVWREQPALSRPARAPAPATWILLADSGGLAAAIATQLEASGHVPVLVDAGSELRPLGDRRYAVRPTHAEDFERLLDDATAASSAPCAGVIHLWGLDTKLEPTATTNELLVAERHGRESLLLLVQALVRAGLPAEPSLTVVTRGACATTADDPPVALAQASLAGLSRVIMAEHPGLRCRMIDLDTLGGVDVSATAVIGELAGETAEPQVAFRGPLRRVARLVHRTVDAGAPAARLGQPGEPYRFEIGTTGTIDAIRPRAIERRGPGPGEVEVEVDVAALNFRDVMKALGIYPGLNGKGTHVFDECAGRVVALGAGVEGLVVGQEVVALAHGCGATSVVADARLTWPKPAQLSAVEAAGVPIVWGTAALGLDHLARVRRGDRVLIHSGAGAIGLAAIELARRAGADIFATAGSAEKRAFVRSRGVEHVMDSRSLTFVDEIRRITNGEGIDVVLNSLSGEAIPASLGLLRQYGRFIEIGKTDIYRGSPLSLGHFQKNLSFSTIDIEPVYLEKREWYGELIGDLLAAQARGELRPVPAQMFPARQLGDAMRVLAQGKNTGKLVVDVRDPSVRPERAPAAVRTDGAYLVTGGAGALGLEVAAWLVLQGARHLVLVGRTAPSPAAMVRIEALRASGARVQIAQADVASEAELANLLTLQRESGVQLRGVFHAAGVLDDGTVLDARPEQFERVLAPKVAGAWNLHRLTRAEPIEMFVLFSSIAAVLGLAGQGAYAAANSFLDGLAHHRAAQGLPALSVNWGPWAEIGLAAAQGNRGDRLAARGLAGLAPAAGIRALDELVSGGATQVTVAALDVPRWLEHDSGATSPLFHELNGPATRGPGEVKPRLPLREALAVEPAEKALARVEDLVREAVAQVLRLKAATVPLHKPLNTLGLDSLMALELRNRLERATELKLKSTVIWSHPTVRALGRKVAEELGVTIAATTMVAVAPSAAALAATPTPPAPTLRKKLENSSTTQLARLLKQKLAGIQEKKRDE
jgi:acyl transferase domain-containing protein/acyl carrier protein